MVLIFYHRKQNRCRISQPSAVNVKPKSLNSPNLPTAGRMFFSHRSDWLRLRSLRSLRSIRSLRSSLISLICSDVPSPPMPTSGSISSTASLKATRTSGKNCRKSRHNGRWTREWEKTGRNFRLKVYTRLTTPSALYA